jgi:hypothetical protein
MIKKKLNNVNRAVFLASRLEKYGHTHLRWI